MAMAFNESSGSVFASSKRRKISGASNFRDNKDVAIRFFEGLNVFILQAGIGRARTSLFQCKIIEFGGSVSERFGTKGDANKPTHLVVDDGMTADRLERILKVTDVSEFDEVRTVRSAWLSECIKMQRLIVADDYEIKFPSGSTPLSDKSKASSQSDKNNIIEHNISHISCVSSKKSKRVPTALSNKEDSDHDSDYQHSCSEDEHQNIESSYVGTNLIAVSMMFNYTNACSDFNCCKVKS